jgi:dihydropteroate synthase
VPVPPADRDRATAAISALAAAAGAWCVRVHEVAGSADAVRVAAAWTGARAAPDHVRPAPGALHDARRTPTHHPGETT